MLRLILILGLILTASGYTSDILGDYIGPIEYKGYLVFDYPEGDNPINNIVFTVDPMIANNMIIVKVPPNWSYIYQGGSLTLSGGSLSPGGSVSVTVSLNKYFEDGEYAVGSVGTTTAGEVSQASGPLLVGELYLLNILGLASAYRYPLTVGLVSLGVLELFLSRRKDIGSEIESVIPELSPATIITEPDGRVFEDDFLKYFDTEEAEWDLNEADYARWKQLQDIEALTAWSTAQIAETQLQTQLESIVNSAMTELGSGINDFAEGVQAYGGAMEILIRDSEGIRSLYNEWNKEGGVKDMMWWADLADAVVSIARFAVSLGEGGAKLIVRALSSVDEGADGARAGEALVEGLVRADDALGGGTGATRAEGGSVKFGEANEIYDGADLAKFDAEIEKLIGRPFDDYAEALPIAARKLGYYMDFTDAEREIILTLIVKARLAHNGKPVVFEPRYLEWLHRMSQKPDFWDNLRKAAALDIDACVYRMVDEVEMGWLRTLADSPEAANAARNLPYGPIPALPPSGATIPPPGVVLPGGGAVTLPPPPSATLPYPGAITLPQGPPPGAATLPGNGAITLPPPNTLRHGVTLPDGGVITLPHGPPPGATLQGGGAITLPPPRSLSPSGTIHDAGVITLPHGQPAPVLKTAPPRVSPMDSVRLGDASANPSGLGGLSTLPRTQAPPSPAEAYDVVRTGLQGGSKTSQGYQIKHNLDQFKGEDPHE